MTAPATHLPAILGDQRDEMVALLTELASLESPSDAPDTQEAPLALLADQFGRLGFHVTLTPGRQSGGYLVARHPAAATAAGQQLLLGHVDTVWPVGTLAEMPLVVEGDRLHGPGVFDMKGGLVQMIFALRALEQLRLRPLLAPLVMVNTDEETGSAESRDKIEQLARESVRAFILEPAAGPEGKLKTARKGVGGFDIVVRGVASHAGLDPEKGVSAVLGMAHVVQQLHELTDLPRGVSVNAGVIRGGLRSNVVAPECRVEVDTRAMTTADAERLTRAIHALESPIPGTTVAVSGGFDRPPLERTPRNAALWELARSTGAELGLALEGTAVGGASDGNFTSAYTATLDGLGPVGDGAHARHEHLIIPRMPERAALLAALMLQPA